MTVRLSGGDSRIVEIKFQHRIYSVSFDGDGKHVLTGDLGGMVRQWRVDDGREVGEPIQVEGGEIYAAALSPDRKWLVCGARLVPSRGGHGKDLPAVWDAHTHEKVFDINDVGVRCWSTTTTI